MIQDIPRRRERVRDAYLEAERVKARTRPSIVCMNVCRSELGTVERCEIAARRAVRYCRRLRDAVGRFGAEPRTRR